MAKPLPNPIRTEWDRRLALLTSMRALRDAHRAFGPLSELDEACKWVEYDLEQKFGSLDRAKADPEAAPYLAAAKAAADAAEDAHYERFGTPLDRAAVLVVMHPAPDADAVRLKVELVKEFELHNWTETPRPPIEVIEEDVRRLHGGGLG